MNQPLYTHIRVYFLLPFSSSPLLQAHKLEPPNYPGYGIIVAAESKIPSQFTAISEAITSPGCVTMIMVYLLGMLVSGHIVWFVERHINPEEFPPGYVHGIDDGVWWSAVTATSTGYGDKVPQSVVGRIWGIVWMNLGIIIFALVAASFTNTLYEKSADPGIYRLDDIGPNTKVAIITDVAHGASEHILVNTRVAKIAKYCDPVDCVALLQTRAVEAVIGAMPRLVTMVEMEEAARATKPDLPKLAITGPTFGKAYSWYLVAPATMPELAGWDDWLANDAKFPNILSTYVGVTQRGATEDLAPNDPQQSWGLIGFVLGCIVVYALLNIIIELYHKLRRYMCGHGGSGSGAGTEQGGDGGGGSGGNKVETGDMEMVGNPLPLTGSVRSSRSSVTPRGVAPPPSNDLKMVEVAPMTSKESTSVSSPLQQRAKSQAFEL